MKKKETSISLTYIGVLVHPDRKEIAILDELMRKFQSAKRFLRERIFEGLERKEAVNRAKPFFLPNSRYMRDAFLEAEASISSQKELLPLYVEQCDEKINKLEKEIKKLSHSHTQNKEQKIQYKQAKIETYTKQRNYFQHHIDHGTVPKIVDGTKKRMEQRRKGTICIEEWRDVRSNAIFSRGEKSKGGNENIKLSYLGGDQFEIAILNSLSSKRNDRLHFTVRFPAKLTLTIATYLETGEAYTIRILRKKGKYQVHLTLEHELQMKPSLEKGIAGIDINPDNLAVTLIYPNGNYRTSKVFWMHDVNTVSAHQREAIIQHTLYEGVRWIQSFGVDTIAIEKLSFLQSGIHKKFNRMASNFAYRSIIQSLLSVAFKGQMALIEVDPHYSSLIGKVKYQQAYGLSIHQSAALVLARRGMGYKEKVPKALVSVLFAKEAKKGHPCLELHQHWKKVKAWLDTALEECKKSQIPIKGILFREIYEYKTMEYPF